MWSLDHDVVLVQPHVAGATGFSLDEMMQGLVYGKQEFAAMEFGSCALLGFAQLAAWKHSYAGSIQL
jgi:hypothetical protein